MMPLVTQVSRAMSSVLAPASASGSVAVDLELKVHGLTSGAGAPRLVDEAQGGSIRFASRGLGVLGRLAPETGAVERTA